VGREKVGPKYPITIEKMTLPFGRSQKNREFTRVSARVVWEQFRKHGGFAIFAAQKSPDCRKTNFNAPAKESIILAHQTRMSPNNFTNTGWK
jgi:hypothetical protein